MKNAGNRKIELNIRKSSSKFEIRVALYDIYIRRTTSFNEGSQFSIFSKCNNNISLEIPKSLLSANLILIDYLRESEHCNSVSNIIRKLQNWNWNYFNTYECDTLSNLYACGKMEIVAVYRGCQRILSLPPNIEISANLSNCFSAWIVR